MYLNADLKSKINDWTDTNLPDWYLGRDQNSDVAFLGIDLYNAWLNIDIFSVFFHKSPSFMQICHNSMFLLQNRTPNNTTHIARKCKNFKNKNNVSLLQLCLQGNMDKSILFFFLNIEHAGNAWIDKYTRIVCYWLHFAVLKLFIYWL